MTLRLAYHRVLPVPPRDNAHILSSAEFERQVELMARSGIAVAAPGEFDSLAASGAHRIGITFDDGFSSDLECAELMHRHGIRGLFFIPTDTIGSPGRLGVEDLRTLVGMGMRIGSHSHEHIPITPECAEYQSKNVQGNPDPITRHANR